MSVSPSLTLAPHSRLRMDLRMGRLGSLQAALREDPDLFNKTLQVSGQPPSRVGDLLLSDAILSCRPPANAPVVTYLLSQGASTPQSAPGLLSMAVSMVDMPVVDRLVAAGWSPDVRAQDALSALEQASTQAQHELLHAWRAHLPGSLDDKGQNLFHHLCLANLWSGGPESALSTARVLITGKVDWLLPNHAGRSPADLCRYPDVVDAIDQAWRRHQSSTRRADLGKVSDRASSEPATRPRRM